jgi:hypothetical protein
MRSAEKKIKKKNKRNNPQITQISQIKYKKSARHVAFLQIGWKKYTVPPAKWLTQNGF